MSLTHRARTQYTSLHTRTRRLTFLYCRYEHNSCANVTFIDTPGLKPASPITPTPVGAAGRLLKESSRIIDPAALKAQDEREEIVLEICKPAFDRSKIILCVESIHTITSRTAPRTIIKDY